MATPLGGFGETKLVTDEIQKICDQVKAQVEEKQKKTFTVFRGVEYRSQIVSGKVFIIKVDGGVTYLHLKVLLSLLGEVTLLEVQEKGKEDPIVPF